MDYTMRGTLEILPVLIYMNYNSTENTLSLKEVSDSFCETMDNKEEHIKECGKGVFCGVIIHIDEHREDFQGAPHGVVHVTSITVNVEVLL